MIKPSDGIKIKTQAVRQIIKKNGEISVEKYDAHILASRKQGTMSIILKTGPKLGIAVRVEDGEKLLKIDELKKL